MDQLNALLAADYGAAGFSVADVSTAFHTDVTSPVRPVPGLGDVPPNVAAICHLTYMCAAAPVGPNIHANPAGYAVMAGAVAARL